MSTFKPPTKYIRDMLAVLTPLGWGNAQKTANGHVAIDHPQHGRFILNPRPAGRRTTENQLTSLARQMGMPRVELLERVGRGGRAQPAAIRKRRRASARRSPAARPAARRTPPPPRRPRTISSIEARIERVTARRAAARSAADRDGAAQLDQQLADLYAQKRRLMATRTP